MAKRLCFFTILVPIIWTAAMLAACRPASPLFECTDTLGCVTIEPDEPVKIGVLQVLTGEFSPIGQEQLQTIELAIAQRNNQLLDHPIELQVEDSRCSTEGGVAAALKVATVSQIVAVLGPTCSGSAATAAQIISEAGMVLISSSSSAPSLTTLDGQGPGADWQSGYFRTAHNGVTQAQVAATFAFADLGVTRAATINDGDTYTRGLTDAFNRVFTDLGGQVILDTAVNKGDANMIPVLTAVAGSKAELIFFPIFPPEGNEVVLQAKELEGMEEIILMSAEGLLVPPFFEVAGAAARGMYFVGPSTPAGAAHNAFISTYKARYGQPPATPFYAHTYDATNLLLAALETVAIKDPTTDGALHIGRQALRDKLYTTRSFEGLTGKLACDRFGDCGPDSFKVVRLDDPAAGIEGLMSNIVYTSYSGQ